MIFHATPPPAPIVWYYPEAIASTFPLNTRRYGWLHPAMLDEQVELTAIMISLTYLDKSEHVQYAHCGPVKASSAAKWRCQVQGSIDFVEKTIVVVNKRGKIKFRVTYSSRKREGVRR